MDSIKYIFKQPYLSNKISQWQVMLFEYEIIYVTWKAIKGNAIVDQLAENAIEDYEPLDIKFLDEDVIVVDEVEAYERDDVWQLYFDRAINHFEKWIRVVLLSLDGKQFTVAIKLRFKCINNVAEYETFVIGLLLAINMKIKKNWKCTVTQPW